MTLYEYFSENLNRSDPYPAIDHQIRAQKHEDGRISFYIHPAGKDGNTPTFWISDAIIATIPPDGTPLSRQKEFLTFPKIYRDAQLKTQSELLASSEKEIQEYNKKKELEYLESRR